MTRKFAVGQRVWRFDHNHRVYRGDGLGGPIYSEHFIEMKVHAIEGRSYVIGRPDADSRWQLHKVGFNKAEKTYKTDDEREDDIWRNAHQWRVADMVRRVDVPTLRKVAALVGYREEE